MGIFQKSTPLEKELAGLQRSEQAFLSAQARRRASLVSRALEDRVPEKLQGAIEQGFDKAFSLVFQKGSGLIEKTLGRERRQEAYFQGRCALDAEADRKNLRSFSGASRRAGLGNRLVSGAAGLGMGVFGVGLPDIPLFTAMVLKSVYETALSYGFDYDSAEEKIFVLTLIRCAVSVGDEVWSVNGDLDRFIDDGRWPEGLDLETAEKAASAALSEELLYVKFLQGIPVVGAVGGVYDAVYIDRVSRYADLKYHRRLLKKLFAERK